MPTKDEEIARLRAKVARQRQELNNHRDGWRRYRREYYSEPMLALREISQMGKFCHPQSEIGNAVRVATEALTKAESKMDGWR